MNCNIVYAMKGCSTFTPSSQRDCDKHLLCGFMQSIGCLLLRKTRQTALTIGCSFTHPCTNTVFCTITRSDGHSRLVTAQCKQQSSSFVHVDNSLNFQDYNCSKECFQITLFSVVSSKNVYMRQKIQLSLCKLF